MATMPETTQVEYDVEVRITSSDGSVISQATARLGGAIKVGAYTPAERAAREAVTEARRAQGNFK